MLQLRLLGKLELLPQEFGDRLTGGSLPTALFVFLATEPPGVFLRRDRLADLFWPETDQDHARANLRKLVYRIRGALGADVIESRGDEEVRLASGTCWCDVVEFRRAVAEGQFVRATELFQGPLMPGFHLSGAPGMQRDIETRRADLSREWTKAALKLLDEYARNQERTELGDLVQVVLRWPEVIRDEHLLRRFLELLGVNDRATAMIIYERFRKWLWEEFRIEPSLETRQLMERIRAG